MAEPEVQTTSPDSPGPGEVKVTEAATPGSPASPAAAADTPATPASPATPSAAGSPAGGGTPGGGTPGGGDLSMEGGSGLLHEAETVMVDWIRQRVFLKGLSGDHWGDEHETIITEFLFHPNLRKLVAFIGPDGQLQLHSTNLKAVLGGQQSSAGGGVGSAGGAGGVGGAEAWQGPSELMYFILRSNAEVTPETMSQYIQYGRVQGRVIDSLLRVMNGVYVPRVLATTTWPESVKKVQLARSHLWQCVCVCCVCRVCRVSCHSSHSRSSPSFLTALLPLSSPSSPPLPPSFPSRFRTFRRRCTSSWQV